ncbi:monocyte to macrophage differentiation factor 2 isoform X2 [Bacillus rossius redtenbacheri]|uniref:monocyte to macrophage differentiation factor 2 isoform X2 n=1 Tax=Bacillus rossius redtenbacheri TaxID=93214 RepID=UPI002FDC9B5E
MTLTERQVKGSWLQHVALLALRSFDWKWMQGVQWMNEKASRNQAYNPTTIEHVANVVTHGVWVLPSMLAGLELLQRARTWPQYFSALVYGAALILLFTVSTFFHSVFFYCNQNRHLKDALHRGDRAMIYVFIAASYFPWVTLQPMPVDEWVAELWWLVWLLASLGIAYQQVFHERYKCLETCVYLLMAVAPSLAMFYSTLAGLYELKVGGLVYMVGVMFFKADGKIPCAHAIWHVFVVMASSIHYFAVLSYLYPSHDLGTRSD